MKKLFYFAAIIFAAMFISCGEEYDDSAIWNEFEKIYSEIEELKDLCKQMNTNISSLQVIVNALQDNDYITSVVPINKDGETIGYTITFSKSQPITIYSSINNQEGADGGNNVTPIIGVQKDSDNIYYWTLNGEWLLDAAGNKIKAQGTDGEDGADGEDGITPQLKIEEGYWYISYDNGGSWKQLGKATGEDGQDGKDGQKGDSFFSSVTQDDEYVYFTLSDGTVLIVPKYSGTTKPDNQNNKIYYTTTDGKKAFPTYASGIDAILLSNSYEKGIGIMTFDDEITNIDNAFVRCATLESVTIPQSVTSIGASAFQNCTSLSVVYCKPTTPPSVKGTDNSWMPFDGNAPRRKIYVPSRSVHSYFYDDNWSRYAVSIKAEGDTSEPPITEIYYTTTDNKPMSISSSEFDIPLSSNVYDEDLGMFVLSFEGQMTSIPKSAFSFESRLATIILPEGIVVIGDSAFSQCENLTSVTLPNSTEWIGNSVFYYCFDLADINIPDNVEYIGRKAFYNCLGLKEIVLGDGVEVVDKSAFERCFNLESITMGKNLTGICQHAFFDCDNLCRVNISDLAAWCNICFENEVANPLHYAKNIYLNGELLTNAVIPEGVAEIKYWAFHNCSSIRNVTIPNSVTSIGYRAFYNCPNLADVTIGNNVVLIDQDGFSNCTSLTNITIPDSVNAIEHYAFRGCSLLENVVLGNSVASIGERVFEGCTLMTSINIPASMTSIGSGTFTGCQNLKSVYISDLTAWCNIDFAGESATPCYNGALLYLNDNLLTDLKVPEGITEIKPYTFHACCSITSVSIPDSVKSIGNGAFSFCISLEKVDLGNGVSSIGREAFGYKNLLTQITIPASVTYIGSDAFDNIYDTLERVDITDLGAWCNINFDDGADGHANPIYYADGLYLNGELLTTAIIPESVTDIKSKTFYNYKHLTSVILHDKITSVGEKAFAGTSITDVTIPKSVTSIGESAFASKKVRINITDLASYCRINFKDSYESPTAYAGNLYLNGELLTNLVIPEEITEINSFTFTNCRSLTNVTLHNGIISIGSEAFSDCTGITEVTIPESVAYLGYCAFCNDNLATVKMLSTTPCQMEDGYNSMQFENAKIYVPSEALYAYRSAAVWVKMAKNIYPFE